MPLIHSKLQSRSIDSMIPHLCQAVIYMSRQRQKDNLEHLRLLNAHHILSSCFSLRWCHSILSTFIVCLYSLPETPKPGKCFLIRLPKMFYTLMKKQLSLNLDTQTPQSSWLKSLNLHFTKLANCFSNDALSPFLTLRSICKQYEAI